MEIPEYIVIVQPRNPSKPEIGQYFGATIAYNETEAKAIADQNSDDINFATIVPCDYSMRGE